MFANESSRGRKEDLEGEVGDAASTPDNADWTQHVEPLKLMGPNTEP